MKLRSEKNQWVRFYFLCKTYSFAHLTKQQTYICKGIAILFIVIHNVVAKIPSAPGYNEFYFNGDYIEQALHMLYSDPAHLITVMMTFLGHYGVQVFIFLSAYGLVRSIALQPNTWKKFIHKRIVQLIIPMLFVMLFYLGLDYFFSGLFSLRSGEHDLFDVLKRMLFISNFIPGEAFLVIGPWWFLSMIMQFYLLFMPLRAMQMRYGNASLAVLSLLMIFIMIPLEPWLQHYGFSLTLTALGHLPEFALGMAVASLPKINVPLGLIILALVGLVLGNMFYLFWFFAPVCATLVIMFLCGLLLKQLPHTQHGVVMLHRIGVLSLYIFLLNGVIREPFVLLASQVNTPLMSYACALVVVMLTLFIAHVFYTLERYLKSILT